MTDVDSKTINSIPLINFGNKIVIGGIVFVNDETDEVILASLPDKTIGQGISIINPTQDEWHDIFNQQDYHYVKGELNGQKVILRKSQRKVDATVNWKVFKRDNYTCRYCGNNDIPLTVDHVVLWQNGGATHVDNLVSACKKCNNTRGDMDYRDWLKSDFYAERMIHLSSEAIMANNRLLNNYDKLPIEKNRRKR